MKHLLKLGALVIAAILLLSFVGMKATGITPLAFGMHAPRQQSDGIAIDGYDVVSYFDQSTPSKGKADLAYDWDGVTWYFASQEHLEAFKTDPTRYAPQYGGYCSLAVSTGFAARSLPESYTIHDGKLYFFHDPEVKAEAMQDLDGMIDKCEASW